MTFWTFECIRRSCPPPLKPNLKVFSLKNENKTWNIPVHVENRAEYHDKPGHLKGTAFSAQDNFKKLLDQFRIPYEE